MELLNDAEIESANHFYTKDAVDVSSNAEFAVYVHKIIISRYVKQISICANKQYGHYYTIWGKIYQCIVPFRSVALIVAKS